MLYNFEGILSAAPNYTAHRKENIYARNMKEELNTAKVPPLAQDLIAMLLDPKPNPCSACFQQVHYPLTIIHSLFTHFSLTVITHYDVYN